MKKQIIILSALTAMTLAFVQAADAAQTLVAKGYTAPIEGLISGESFRVESNEITGGKVTIDTDEQTIALTVDKETSCVGKLICPPTLNNQLSLKLQISKIDRDHCGVLEYTAEQQITSGSQVLVVRDNSESICRTFIEIPRTTVSLVKQTRSGEASALFSAGALQELR
jgi:hypothetical protein